MAFFMGMPGEVPGAITDTQPSTTADPTPIVVEGHPEETEVPETPEAPKQEPLTPFTLTTKGLRYQKTYYMPSDRVARFSKRWCKTEGADKKQFLEFVKSAFEQVPSVYEEYKNIGSEATSVQDDPKALEKRKKDRQEQLVTKTILNLVSVGLKVFGESNEPWCKTSSSANQNYPWYSTEQAFTPPDITLDRSTKSIVDAYSSFGTNYTYVFADKFSALIRGIENQLPEEVEARLKGQWYVAGGQSWPQDKNKRFEALVSACKDGFKIRYDEAKDLYEYTPQPDLICLKAMKMVAGDKKITTDEQQTYNPFATQAAPKQGPVEELEKLIKTDYFLGLEWPDLVQLKTFVDPINEQSWAVRFAARAVLAPAKYYVSFVALFSGIGSVVARMALADVGIWTVTKFVANPLNLKYLFPTNWKKIGDFFKKNKKPPKDPPAPSAPAEGGAPKPAAEAEGAPKPVTFDSLEKALNGKRANNGYWDIAKAAAAGAYFFANRTAILALNDINSTAAVVWILAAIPTKIGMDEYLNKKGGEL